MRVPGLQSSNQPARPIDRGRAPFVIATILACLALNILALGALVLAHAQDGAHRTSIGLPALFGLCIVLSTLLALQTIVRRRSEFKLEGTIRRQSRLLEEISSMSTMVELLKLLPGVSGALYVSRRDDATLELQVGWGSGATAQSFASEDCWALRRGRPHLYEPASAATVCPHVGESDDACLCVPLVSQGDTLAVLHLRPAGEGSLSEDVQRLASVLAEQLSLAVGNLRLQETLRSGSERDPLTDLYNRRHLEISLHRELARAQRHGFPVSLLMLDVDHFKAFNDTNGHDAGDEVLRNVAHVLKRHTRVEDVACRYGGEEFLVV